MGLRWDEFFGSALLQPAPSVCVSSERFFIIVCYLPLLFSVYRTQDCINAGPYRIAYYFILTFIAASCSLSLEMGKNPQFWFGLGSLMIRVRFCSSSEYLKIRFIFGSSSVKVGFGFCSVQLFYRRNSKSISVMVICYWSNCKYQLTD